MRFESRVTAVSWLPSEAVRRTPKLPFAIGAAHYDDPPPASLGDPAALADSGAVRLVNDLRAWIEVEDGRIVSTGYSGGGHVGVAELDLADGTIRGRDAVMPLEQQLPVVEGDSAHFRQSFGGRIGLTIPRLAAGLTLFRLHPPLAWTTLALTIRADGTSDGALSGSSSFPRHWIYDVQGELASKSAELDLERWLEQPIDTETPWGNDDGVWSAAPESELERELSKEIMKSRPRVLTIEAGEWLTERGRGGTAAFLILDGVLDVYVGGQEVAEIGPGAIVGERASVENRRTATLQARTTCRFVRFDPAELSPQDREALASRHRHEDE
jgi:hypothetical protein